MKIKVFSLFAYHTNIFSYMVTVFLLLVLDWYIAVSVVLYKSFCVNFENATPMLQVIEISAILYEYFQGTFFKMAFGFSVTK